MARGAEQKPQSGPTGGHSSLYNTQIPVVPGMFGGVPAMVQHLQQQQQQQQPQPTPSANPAAEMVKEGGISPVSPNLPGQPSQKGAMNPFMFWRF